MRRFLICSGVHSRPKSLEWLQRAVETRHPDGILFAGGVLDMGRQYTSRTTPWGLTHDDAIFIEKFFETLGHIGIFSAVIPGPVDTPLEDFLRAGMHAEVTYPNLHMAHATLIERGDVAVSGIGGCIMEGHMTDVDRYSRTVAEYFLRPFRLAPQPHTVLLLATPPLGPLGGSDGSRVVSELIDSYHPSLCVVNGPHETRGVQHIAHTTIVNPGHVAEGWAAWLDWNRDLNDQVSFLNLRDLEMAKAMADVGVCD